MFEIENDIPPPPAKGPHIYGFERLQPGQSFLVPCERELRSVTTNRVRWALKKYRRTHAKLSKWRTAKNTLGIRVWRVA